MSFSTKPRQRVSIDFSDTVSLTEQHHKDACDIHNILKRAQQTGVMEHMAKYEGTYGTMPSGDEFHAHMNALKAAESMFESVPSFLRNRFENDPAKFLDYISNNKNYDEMEKQGFDVSHLTKPAPPEPKTKVENATPEVSSQV